MHHYDTQPKNPKQRILFFLLLLSLNDGCMFHRENILQDAEYRLVGKTKDELVACAGKPSATRFKEGNEFLIYTNGLPGSDPNSCKLTFILIGGKVSKFDFKGDLTGVNSSASACYQVVRNCW